MSKQRQNFIKWYASDGKRSKNSANTYATAIGKTKLKNGKEIFEILFFDELDTIIKNAGLDDYFQKYDGDYEKMNTIFFVPESCQKDDLKSGIKFYLEFLKVTDFDAEIIAEPNQMKINNDLELIKMFIPLFTVVIGGLLAVGINYYAHIDIIEWIAALLCIGLSLLLLFIKLMFVFEHSDKLTDEYRYKHKYFVINYVIYASFYFGMIISAVLVIDLVISLRAAI